VTALFGQFPFKTVVVIVVWALAHHVLAGVRHLLTDVDIGSPLRVARRSAWFVNLAGVAVALLAAGVMW
jgi:succinate dehydrogenase / fumarate reductase cytochrome b subunit